MAEKVHFTKPQVRKHLSLQLGINIESKVESGWISSLFSQSRSQFLPIVKLRSAPTWDEIKS